MRVAKRQWQPFDTQQPLPPSPRGTLPIEQPPATHANTADLSGVQQRRVAQSAYRFGRATSSRAARNAGFGGLPRRSRSCSASSCAVAVCTAPASPTTPHTVCTRYPRETHRHWRHQRRAVTSETAEGSLQAHSEKRSVRNSAVFACKLEVWGPQRACKAAPARGEVPIRVGSRAEEVE
jgi:hypothetical protein